MMFDVTQKLDQFARLLLPGMCAIVLLMLSLIPIGLTGQEQFPVDACLIAIYYWTIFRPATMPFWFVFLLGIMRDALTVHSLGISSLMFLLFRLMVLSLQRFLVKETFWATWLGFGVVMVPAMVLHWLMSSAYAQTLLPVTPAIMQWTFTFGLYPLLHIMFNALYRFLPAQAGRSKQHSAIL